jgi:hypothetical protein
MSNSRIVYPRAQVADLISDEVASRYLCLEGLPAHNVLFLPMPSPRLLQVGQPPVRYLDLGRTTTGTIIGLHPATGEVVAISDLVSGAAWHANADLEKFVSSIQEFDDRSPFYTGTMTEQQLERSALDLAARLTDIDPTSLRDEHCFWAGLVFDVGLGDYSDL